MITEIIENVAFGISILSFIVIVYGAIIAIIKFVTNEAGRLNGRFTMKNLNTIKLSYSYYLLLGLDFLIASDVVRTIVENTINDLAILGISVVIRTVLSFFLGREMKEDQDLRKDY